MERTVFDLDSFEEVTLVYDKDDFTEVKTVDEATQRLGNNSDRLLSIINDGLKAEHEREIAGQLYAGHVDGWRVQLDDGNLNGEFKGVIADQKAVNQLRLTLAKSIFGYRDGNTKDQNRAAKEKAMNMIKTNEVMKAGLKDSAARSAGAAGSNGAQGETQSA